MSKQIGIVFAAAAFVLAWSSGFIVAKIGTEDVPVLTVLLWRFVPLAVGLAIVLLVSGQWRNASQAQLRSQLVIGLFAQFGYVVFVYASVAVGISTGTTALIDAVQPLVIAALAGPLLHVRVPGAQWLGLGIGAVGVFLIVQSQFGASDAPPIAYALPALAMASLITATILERRSPHRSPVLLTLTVHATATTVLLAVLALATGAAVPPGDATFWLTTLFLALVPTLSAYGLYWWLLRRIGVTVLNALLFLVAPTTAVAGALLFREPFTLLTAGGFLLSAAGVALVLVSDARGRVGARSRVSDPASGAPAGDASPRRAPDSAPQGAR
ncbi:MULTISPECIES: DMT family transporter [unclassified Plantibacter]|uniref:DMT family transporter n=1 Tax=unclassified Plantibacter TaxID=2624265 RepID=UPI0009E8A04B|nr:MULTISPECIES: DMT family transporter [unclassified Plantibacter]